MKNMKYLISILRSAPALAILLTSNLCFSNPGSFDDGNPVYSVNSSGNSTTAVSITYSVKPKKLQLFARDNQDSAAVTYSGKVNSSGYDSMYLEMYKNNIFQKRKVARLTYSGGYATFSLSQNIHAELSEYSFYLYIIDAGIITFLTSADSILCGDAYIISGQSNADRTSSSATYKNEFCRTFGVQTVDFNNSNYAPADTAFTLSNSNGADFYNNSYPNVGVWGLRLQKLIKENFGIPTCIINGALGGSFIEMHMRNNSNPMDLTTVYGKLLYRVSKAGLCNGIKGIFWYQGESNGNSTWVNYANNFNTLYNSWKTDYPKFEKIFLYQTRPCCQELYSSQLREVQRNLPFAYKDIEILSTNGALNYDGWHYDYNGYTSIGDMSFIPVCQKFYNVISDTTHCKPPNIWAAYFTSTQKNRIALLFENSVVARWPNDTLGQSMKNYFYLNGSYGAVTSGNVSGDTLYLNLTGTSSATKITYLPSLYINNSSTIIYEGPYLKNPKNLGILSFHDFPVSNYYPVTINIKMGFDGTYNSSTGNLNSKEIVTVYVRNNYYPYTIKDSSTAYVDSTTLTGKFVFRNLPQGTYYLVLKGRNILETWSKNPGVTINAGATITYDFTASASQAYGNNLILKGNKYCVYNSDVNQDGFLDGLDNMKVSNDANILVNGHGVSDLNGDYFVDGADLIIADHNSSSYVSKVTP